ncbi:MAG: sugar phosphate nucleotidyltransferase [SAR324 cluster bacterium]|nr:sugar phosphate nucleotidyltransferase [SAR324 cluster bacterium]
MKAVVLCAGQSPKLEPFSETRPKSMIVVAGKSILEIILNRLSEANITEVLLVVGHKKEMIQESFHFGKALGLKIDYLIQKEEKGIGNALLLAQEALKKEKNFLVVYGDALMNGNNLLPLVDHFSQSDLPNIATITHPASEGGYGNVYLGHDMQISKFVEKPTGGRMSNYIFGGSFIFDQSVFASLQKNKEDMVAVLKSKIKEKALGASLWEDSWIDISRPWHILKANQMVMSTWTKSIIPVSCNIDSGAKISGAVKFGENVTVRAGASIVGPCFIGDNCFIGNSSLIRENSSIGANSVIGFGTEVKNSVIFGGSKVGRLSFIGDSVLGQDTHLGSGVMTVNTSIENHNFTLTDKKGDSLDTGLSKIGAFIGDNSVIGAGNCLPPGCMLKAGTHAPDCFNLPSNL